MTKQETFLLLVQTGILANGINLSSAVDAEQRRGEFSATGVLGTMYDAVRASWRIPEDMSAIQAADEFCGFMFDSLQPAGAVCPDWFANLDADSDSAAADLSSGKAKPHGRMSAEDFRAWRNRHGWKQREAAAQLQVSQGVLSEWENGRRPVPRYIARMTELVDKVQRAELQIRLAGGAT